jgi:hypothetical protein
MYIGKSMVDTSVEFGVNKVARTNKTLRSQIGDQLRLIIQRTCGSGDANSARTRQVFGSCLRR